MPEGPECRIIADGLTKLLGNKTLVSFEINSKNRYYKKAPDGFVEFAAALPVKIVCVKSHGKFIWWELSNGWYIWQTLGLSGGWFTVQKANSGIVITMDGGLKLYYDDARHFGTLKFISPMSANKETVKKLNTLGPDILGSNKITKLEYMYRMRKYPCMLVASILMEQKVMSGIGNYLRSEILYDAKVNPHTKVGDLTDDQLGRLYDSTYTKTISSYKAGGASIQHYSDIYSVPGKFAFEMQVYGRKKTPDGLPVKAEKIGKETQTTYWVENNEK